VGAVSQLEVDALVKILTEPRNALVKQYQRLFEFEDIELEVTAEALSGIATQALERGTGARGLRAILEEVLLEVMYELPGDEEAGRVVVDVDSVFGRTSPVVFPRSAEHPDRAAS
jgi:ATP-dependent Clp protease ATP-binding subunit ClpX